MSYSSMTQFTIAYIVCSSHLHITESPGGYSHKLAYTYARMSRVLFLPRPLLDWIENQPTHCSLIPESEAAVQLHTQVSVFVTPGSAAVQQLPFLVLSSNRWADSLSNPVSAYLTLGRSVALYRILFSSQLDIFAQL